MSSATCPVLEAIHAAGLCVNHARALISLTTGSSQVGEIARRIGVSSANGTIIADRLEELALVETYQELIDRRKRHVALTKAGLDLAAKILKT